MTGTALDRDFFARPAPTVARGLVGMLLVQPGPAPVVARIVETEAYTQHDPACHAYRRRTAHNAPLYGPPGHAYVYRSYGVHWMLNTATGSDGVAAGVLIRAAEPLDGLEVMARRRRRDGPRGGTRELLRGPGRLAQAYGLGGHMSGADLCVDGAPLRYVDDGTRPRVVAGPRVGVSRAAEWPWRFAVPDCPWVSRYVRSPRAPAVRGHAMGAAADVTPPVGRGG